MLGTGCGALLLGAGTYLTAQTPETPTKVPLLTLTAAATLLFAFQLWRLTKPQVVLYADKLEKFGMFRSSILHRENVKGVGKTVYSRSGSYFEIASKSPIEPSVQLDGALRKDPVVAEWLKGAADPKAEALKAERAEILADPRYGATETERANRLERAKQWTTALNICCLMLAAWVGFLAPLSPTTLLAAVAPLIVATVLSQMSNGLVVWLGRVGRPRIIGAAAPLVALGAHAGLTIHMLNPDPLAWGSVLIGVATIAQWYATQVTAASRLRSAIAVGVMAALTTYGLGVALDVCLDRTPSKTFFATVINERVSHGKSTKYYLALSSWSDQPTSEVTVSSSFYDSTPIGSQVCVIRRIGSLGLGWFDVTHCSAADAPVNPSALQYGISQPNWVSLPTGAELARLYPERAQRLNVEGEATVQCRVQLDGLLTDCLVIYETPQGYGFGIATLKAATHFRMRPGARNGQPVMGQVTIPLKWRLR